MMTYGGQTFERLVVLALTAVALSACGRAVRTAGGDANSTVDSTTAIETRDTTPSRSTPTAGMPVLTRLVPESARMVANGIVDVRVTGVHFEPGMPGNNVVELGPIRLTQVPANDSGTQLRFVVPDRVPSSDEAPPRRLFPGDYPLTVTTRAGRSNALSFRVLP